jgi:hypothetical protein
MGLVTISSPNKLAKGYIEHDQNGLMVVMNAPTIISKAMNPKSLGLFWFRIKVMA